MHRKGGHAMQIDIGLVFDFNLQMKSAVHGNMERAFGKSDV
jgi:hypothetical protein